MRRPALLTLLLLLPVLTLAQNENQVKHVDAEQASKLVQKGETTVLDVRTAEEFQEAHIQGAINVDILSKDFAKQVGALDTKKPLLVHCQAGGRSTRSLPTLEKLGFPQVYHLDGGINAWLDAGKPVTK